MRVLQPRMTGKDMKDKQENNLNELRSEYDFDYTKAERGKYYKRLLEEGANVVVLEPDVAEAFHDSVSVNQALRSILHITQSIQRLTEQSGGQPKSAAGA